jgi:Histidinol-phosphate/aromatic aminotransferase and cobyric acid decarboxylase
MRGYQLHLNENIFGPSPNCLEVMKNTSFDDIYMYASGNEFIENAISDFYNISSEQVIVSNGSSEILKMIFEAVLNLNDIVCLPKPGWDYYRVLASLVGASVYYYSVKEEKIDFTYNIDQLCEQIRKLEPKIIVITSPNMPTGNTIPDEDLENILKLADRSLVVLDEAYYGFSLKGYFNESEWINKHSNLIIVRTFSKLYGLANLRIGYAICNKVMKSMLNKIAPLFGVSGIAQKIAVQALKDSDYYSSLCRHIINIREKFREKINAMDSYIAFNSHANFVLIKMKRGSSEEAISVLSDNGYIIRSCYGYGMNDYLRISIGKEKCMDDIAKLLYDIVG